MTDFAEYSGAGWKLCDISPGTKAPLYGKWGESGNWLKQAPRVGHGMGLLHAFSNTCAIDIDHYPTAQAWLEERGVDIDELLNADDAVRIQSGRPNSAKLLYALPEPRVSVNLAPYESSEIDPKTNKPKIKAGLNFRCASSNGTSMQDVLPPTIHPDMQRPYEWVLGDTAMLLGPTVLPPLPEAIANIWAHEARPVGSAVNVPLQPPPAAPRQELIDRFLESHDAGGTRAEWVEVGMVLHHEYAGSADGFRAWQIWSARDPAKYDDEAREKMYPMWRGFRSDKQYTATIDRWLAKQPTMPGAFAPVVAEQEEITPAKPASKVAAGLPEQERNHTEIAGESMCRRVMENRVITVLDGRTNPYRIVADPTSPLPRVDMCNGSMLNTLGLRTLFGPLVQGAMIPKKTPGQKMEQADPVDVLQRYDWSRTASASGFHPGRGILYDGDTPETLGVRYLNNFTPFTVEPVTAPPWVVDRIDWLFSLIVDVECRDWVKWLFAYKLVNPGIRVLAAPLLVSETQGTGKSTITERVPRILFRYATTIPMSELKSEFATARFARAWWVAFPELCPPGGKLDQREIADKVKPWITQESIAINAKHVATYEMPNFSQITANSNRLNALHVEDGHNERRWCIGRMIEKRLNKDQIDFLNPIFGEHGADARAPGWLRWYFLNRVDAGLYGPRDEAPWTQAREEMARRSGGPWESNIDDAVEGGVFPFDRDIVHSDDVRGIIMSNRAPPCTRWHVIDQLRRLHAVQVRSREQKGLWAWRNQSYWEHAAPAEVYAHWKTGVGIDPATDLL